MFEKTLKILTNFTKILHEYYQNFDENCWQIIGMY